MSKILKRAISFAIAFALVFGLFPPVDLHIGHDHGHDHGIKLDFGDLGFDMAPTANATTVTVLDGKVSVSDTQNKLSGNATTMTATATGSLISKKTNTITIVNSSDKKLQISFDYSIANANSYKIDGDSAVSASGIITKTLEADGTITIEIQSKSGFSGTTVTLTLSNITATEVKESSNVTFEYDAALGSVAVAGNTVADGDVVSVAGTGATLVATANGSTFLGWVDGEGKIISTAASYTLVPAQDMTVKAAFAQNGGTPWFAVGASAQKSASSGLLGLGKLYYYEVGTSYLFDDLNEAASSGKGNAVVLMNNATLPAGTYTIPSGVTLLIPYDSANTMFTTQVKNTGTYTTPSAYRTLTMATGANLVVNGAVSVSAMQKYANGGKMGGVPTGAYGHISMNADSTITVNNGGTLYAYGFITGSGTVTANSGANVYEMFQIMDFRGGTVSTSMENGVFPLSQYYVQNIEVPLTLYSGATEYSYTTIYMSSSDFGTSVAFIASEDAMFNLTSGYVVKDYDEDTDRLVVELHGDVTMSPIDMSVGTSSINSREYDLGLNGNITLTVKPDSKVTIGQDLAFMPGSEIFVEEGAICQLGSGINVYIYDADQWGAFTFGGYDYIDAGQQNGNNTNHKFIPVVYAPGRTYTRTEADLVDARIVVNGVMDASAGNVYTTAGGANIISTGSGVVKLGKPGAGTVTYQLVQGTGYTEIPITPVKLKNADGSYVETKYVAGTYTYTNGEWVKVSCEHDFYIETVTNAAGCETSGLGTYKCKDTVNCGYSYTGEIPATGHTPGADADCEHDQTCTVCNKVLTEKLGHKYEEVVTAPTCTEQGYTTHTCSACGKNYVDTYVDALGHTAGETVVENEVAAGCESTGSYDNVVYCTVCDAELSRETITVAALGHDEVAHEAQAPTCTEIGWDAYVTCSRCDYTTYEEKEALGHDEVAHEAQAPTCTEIGWDAYVTCSRCDYTTYEEKVALGHTAGTAVKENEKAPTCTAEGSYDNVVYCSVCDAELSRETVVVAATGHNMVAGEVTAPTCTADGYTTYTCSNSCGHTEQRDVVAATGHTAGEVKVENEVAAGCESTGSYENVVYCTVCDAELSRETVVVAATGHQYTDENTKCDHCDHVRAAYIGDVSFDTFEAAMNAAKEGDTIVVLQKIVVTGDVTWDLDGITLDVQYIDKDNYGMIVKGNLTINGGSFRFANAFGIGVTGTLTVNDGNFSASGYNDYLIGNWGTTVINGGSFSGQYCCVNNFSGTTEIKGGTFETDEFDYTGEYESSDLLADAGLIVTGGTFSKDVTVYCDEGYHTVKGENGRYVYGEHVFADEWTHDDDNHWHVCVCGATSDRAAHAYDDDFDAICDACGYEREAKTLIAMIGNQKFDSLAAAVAAAKDGETIVLCSNVTLTEKLTVETSQIWNFGDYTVTTADGNGNYGLVVKGDLSIERGNFYVTGIYGIGVTGKLTVNGGSFTYNGDSDYLIGNWGTTVINGGSLIGQYCCVNNFSGSTTINGGDFTTADTDYTGEYESSDLLADAGLIVTGGTFSKDVTVYCGEGYHTVKGENDRYVYGEHSYKAAVTAPTCTEKGYTTYTCACGDSYVADEVAALGHTEGEAVVENNVEPSCTADGSYENVVYCTVCNAELSRVNTVVSATGHTAGEVVKENEVAPNCDTEGSYDNVVYCSVCDAELSRETVTVDALGHTDADADGSCDDCNVSIVPMVRGDLDMDGDVDSNDLTLLARHIAGIELLTGQKLENADANGDGEVNSDDLTKHARYVAGIIKTWEED